MEGRSFQGMDREMNKKILIAVGGLLLGMGMALHSRQVDFPKLTGPYLGQTLPGMTPEIFAPGIISTELHDDAAPVFSPDGNEVYFRIVYKIEETNYGTIFMMRLENGVWSSPKVAPFSGQYMDGSVTFSKDFQKLYFGSTRSDGDKLSGDLDLWEVSRVGSGWGKPNRLRELNSEGNESYPSESSDGALYWTVEAKRNDPKPEIFRSRRIDGQWTKRERVNFFRGSDSARNFVFAPDGSFILFTMGTPDHDVDLYVGFKRDDGSWGDPINLGPAVNSSYMDKCPSLSPDGKFLFFVSSRPNGNKNPQKVWPHPLFKNLKEIFSADVYWVSSKIIDELRPKESKYNR
jgi:Tol biopolymer transport system component